MSRGSYLTKGKETVQVSSCPRSFEQIVADVDRTSPQLVSYGLYLSTTREMARLLKISKEEMSNYFAAPWTRLKEYRGDPNSGDVPKALRGVIDLGYLAVSKDVLDTIKPMAIHPVLDLLVIQMNVQDLISAPRSRSKPTIYEVRSPFQVDIITSEDCDFESFTLRFHRIEFLSIQQCDIEMILRAKAAESPVLSLQEVSSLLNPLIPTFTLREHRTVNALVDWAVIQGDQSGKIESVRTDPSGSWKRLRRV